MLIAKAKQGVEVRFIYDDFGSPTIKRKTEVRMRAAGVQVFPFHKVRFYLLANRINYRNHRKIVVIDGHTAFVGGINVSDRYINSKQNKLFWRDTHVKIQGPGVYYLQYLFITDWNFCCEHKLKPGMKYFTTTTAREEAKSHIQIAAGGPDSIFSSIQYSILQAIYLAEKEILITTPYFIPGDSIVDALSVAALSGLSVKLLVPGLSDSKLVNAASRSNYSSLLLSGVEIYTYQKGFVHAKTMVADGLLSIVGTANMDVRSFDLNFEVNALIYDEKIATIMRAQFFEDIKHANKLDVEKWIKRSLLQQLSERLARLFSPVLRRKISFRASFSFSKREDCRSSILLSSNLFFKTSFCLIKSFFEVKTSFRNTSVKAISVFHIGVTALPKNEETKSSFPPRNIKKRKTKIATKSNV